MLGRAVITVRILAGSSGWDVENGLECQEAVLGRLQ